MAHDEFIAGSLPKLERLKKAVSRRRAALQGSLAPLGVSVGEVEDDLRDYVGVMKNSGATPEQLVIAVKTLL